LLENRTRKAQGIAEKENRLKRRFFLVGGSFARANEPFFRNKAIAGIFVKQNLLCNLHKKILEFSI
jgi:hypothetical protein